MSAQDLRLRKRRGGRLYIDVGDDGRVLGATFSFSAGQAESAGNPGISTETTRKILSILREKPSAGRREMALRIGNVTEDGVKFHLEKLKSEGKIRRIGPRKGGKRVIAHEETE